MGVAVFSGMLGVTFFGLFLTPVFYVVLQGLRERTGGTEGTGGTAGDGWNRWNGRKGRHQGAGPCVAARSAALALTLALST